MYKNSLSRRKFLKWTSAFGTLALIPGSFFRKIQATALSDSVSIAAVKSTDFFNATIAAVDAIGGMSRFVSKGAKVGLLVNGEFTNEGTFTNPDVSMAVLKMCYDAGAKEIMLIKGDNEDNWKKAVHYEEYKHLLEKTTRSAGNKMFTIEKGKILKEAEMVQEVLDFDTLINIPVSKHHNGAMLTCSLKNMMGLCTRSTNVLFHSPTGQRPTDNNRLAQCIADVNTLRKANLTVVDATSYIINNGPHGPGEIQEDNTVLASIDPVALDAYCATLLDYEPGMVASTDYAAEHQLGEANLEKITINQIELS